jgi:hypothetical protein
MKLFLTRIRARPCQVDTRGSKPGTPDAGKFCTGFPRHNFAIKKKGPLGPKNGLERRAWQFYTICDKNQGLNVKIDEVTTILVPQIWAGQLQVTSGSAQKFVWGSIWWIFKNRAVTSHPHPPTLASASILQFVTVRAQFEHLRPGR